MKNNKIIIFLFLCGCLLLPAERLPAETNWIKSFQPITNAGIAEHVMLDGALPELVKMYPPVTNVVFNCQGGSDMFSPGDGEGFSLSRAGRWEPGIKNPEAMEIFFRLSADTEQMEVELEYLDHALNARSFSIYLDGLTVATANTPFTHLADPALEPGRTGKLRTVKVRVIFLPRVKNITHHSLKIISTDTHFGSVIIDSISLRGRGVEILHPETLTPLNSEQLAAEARRKAGIAEDDVKRGYFAYFPSDYRSRIPIRTIDVDMGVNEHEFMELGIFSYKPIGGTEIKLINKNYPGDIQIAVEEEKKIRYKTNLTPVMGQRNSTWLIMDSKGVPAGNYKCRLTVSPEKAVPYEIALNITVWPIELPAKRKFLNSFFHSGISSVFSYLYPNSPVEQWPGLWGQSMADLQMAGQNIMEFYPSKPIVKIITVTRFEKDYLPVLDFSAWDPYLDTALKHGMEHVMVRYSWFRGDSPWMPPDYKQFPDTKKKEVDLFIIRQIYTHFKEKGFKRVFYYYIDEPKPGEFGKNHARIQPIRDLLPGLEFAGSGFNISMSLEEMQLYCNHLTWLAPYYGHGQKFFDAMQNGELKLLPSAIIATQSSSQALHDEYWNGRLACWRNWKAGFTGCQNYTYCVRHGRTGGETGYRYSSVLPEDNKRIFTPIFFGYADGYEDLAYLTMLNDYLKELENRKNTRVLKHLENRLKTIVGDKGSVLQWKWMPGYRSNAPTVMGDDEAMREAKKEVLRILSKRKRYESKWCELLMRLRDLF